MPLPDFHFVPCFPLQEYFVNKDLGTPLASGVVTFYRDAARSVLKPVYQQVQVSANVYGFVQLNNPITLTSVGTFADDNGNDIIPFLFPYDGTPSVPGAVDLYYITVEAALPPVGTGALQFTREAWPPGLSSNTNPADNFQSSDNIISNPEFSRVLFQPFTSHTYSVTGNQTSTLAQDWDLVTTGTGTVIVSQTDIVDDTAPGNPSYALHINSSGGGLTSVKLRQRLTETPRILGGGFASSLLIAKSFTGSPIALTMDYIPSTGTTVNLINASTTATDFSVLKNSLASIIPQSNPDPGNTGYVDIVITLPVGSPIEITCVQVVSVQNINSSAEYLETTVNRQIDHLYHYYNLPLQFKPINSYLIGWDFPLNPAQFGVTMAATANASSYMWDQTILFQSVINRLSVNRAASGAIQVNCAVGATQGALIQYLDSSVVKDVMYNDLSVNIEAQTDGATSLQATVSIYVTSDPTLPLLPLSVVTGLNADGSVSSTSGTWELITRSGNLGNATFTITSTTGTSFNTYSFNGWNALNNPATTALLDTATYIAVVVGTAAMQVGHNVQFRSISMVPGKIPTPPAPKTATQVLFDCFPYYQRSYAPGVLTGTALAESANLGIQTAASAGGNDFFYASLFSIVYRVPMRTIPTLTFYAYATGTIDNVSGELVRNGTGTVLVDIPITNWTAQLNGKFGVTYAQNNITQLSSLASTAPTYQQGLIWYHYVTDARLGFIP